jgi:hypothetical protein
LQVSKLRTITLPLGQKTSRLGALFSFLGYYRQIFTFEKPWLPIQREKRGGFSFKTSYKQLEIDLLGEGVVLGVCSNIVVKIDEVCLYLRRDARYPSFSLHQEIRKKQIL